LSDGNRGLRRSHGEGGRWYVCRSGIETVRSFERFYMAI